jgi:hypothetical protein
MNHAGLAAPIVPICAGESSYSDGAKPIWLRFLLAQHHQTALDLIAAKTSDRFAMWADDRRLAGDRNPQVRVITGIEGPLKGDKPRAS